MCFVFFHPWIGRDYISFTKLEISIFESLAKEAALNMTSTYDPYI